MMQLDIASNLSTKVEQNGMGMGMGMGLGLGIGMAIVMMMGLSFRLT